MTYNQRVVIEGFEFDVDVVYLPDAEELDVTKVVYKDVDVTELFECIFLRKHESIDSKRPKWVRAIDEILDRLWETVPERKEDI